MTSRFSCIVARYIIIYISVPQLSTSIVRLLSHLLQPAVCGGGVVCVQGRGRPASREAWSGHSTTSLEGTRAAMVPLSPSPIWPPHLSHPSIHPSQCFLLARVPAAASHVTIEPGLDGCCSESRESPIWTTGETEERTGRRTATDQMYFIPRPKSG